jgi:hypothetical protein
MAAAVHKLNNIRIWQQLLFCTAACGIFSSNPRRIHSGKKDEEKEEYGLL